MLLDHFWPLPLITQLTPIFLSMKSECNQNCQAEIGCSLEDGLVSTHTPSHTLLRKQAQFQAVNASQQSREIGKGSGGLWSVSRSSFMFDIVHKLFSLPVCGGGGVSVGWIGLSEAEVRKALLIIGRTKYSPTAWVCGHQEKEVPGGQEDESGCHHREKN